uniref:Uncharacterized protein n=1 Tax=Cacopsylla melanoneura TaxID=428564 RepID=A0A8D9B9U1_9HEMI
MCTLHTPGLFLSWNYVGRIGIMSGEIKKTGVGLRKQGFLRDFLHLRDFESPEFLPYYAEFVNERKRRNLEDNNIIREEEEEEKKEEDEKWDNHYYGWIL